jgi:hypothetical protein
MNKGLRSKVTSVAKEPIDPKRRHVLYPPCRFSHQGFTFLELVIILAIIGTFSSPGWKRPNVMPQRPYNLPREVKVLVNVR